MTELIRKTSELSELKVVDEDQGIVQAYVNTMGVEDADGDVIEPTAFDNSIEKNLPISVLHSHDPGAVIGKVLDAKVIPQEDGSAKLWNLMKFNLETQAGRDAFSNIKGQYIKEYSVGFNIPEKAAEFVRDGIKTIRKIMEVDWIEVSSVVKGASPMTGTLSAKQLKLEEAKRAIPYKQTPTTEEAWDGPRVIASIPGDLTEEELSQFYAYQIVDADPEAKSSYKLPHHENDDGTAGAANVRALSAAVAALNGARGGVDIPDADRQAVYDHLKSHMDDAGLETPELKKKKPKRSRRYEEPITQQKIDQSDQDNRQLADLGADLESADLTDVEAIYNRIALAKARNKLIKFKRKEKYYGNK
jgi:HK97 family phage prohead protease